MVDFTYGDYQTNKKIQDAINSAVQKAVDGSSRATLSQLPLASLQAFKRSLDNGRNSALQVLGDSTGNDAIDWPYRTMQSIAPKYPSYTVQSRLWNDTTQQYDPPVTIQTGTAGVQYLDCVVDAGKNTLLAPGAHPASGNLDIRVKLSSTDWSTNPALANIASRSGTSGQYSHWINYTTGRTIQFVYSTTGANTLTATSTAAVPFTGTQIGWVRVVAIGNNGTQAEFRFYTSTDGSTWTQLGATVNATSYTLFDGGFSFEFGGRGVLNFPGKIYEIEYRDGENGPTMASVLPGNYTSNPLSTADAVVKGAPVLTLVNGSRAGAGTTYLSDSTRLPKLIPHFGQSLCFVNSAHNEGNAYGNAWLETFRTFLNSVLSRRRMPLVVMTQNPEQVAAGVVDAQAARRIDLLQLSNEHGVMDTYQLFLDNPSWSSQWMADSIHPNTTGMDKWRDYVLAHFNAT